MKLKSLLLGSAAVLALSTGAQAADPIVEFVSLGVCDALGMSGLTIESDDTCLLISGGVQYDYTIEEFDGDFDRESDLNWDLAFEAQTQTDDGVAVAVISFEESNPAGTSDGTEFGLNEAYAQFILSNGTALSAGLRDSIFDTENYDKEYGNDIHEEFDLTIDAEEAFGAGEVATGGHSISLEAVVADGFTVLASLEDLEGDGTAGLGVAYDGSGISAEAGVLFGNLYGTDATAADDLMNAYARVAAEFENFAARAGIIFDQDGYWVANIGADATFDMFSLTADAAFDEDEDFYVAGEGSFAATEALDVYLGAGYREGAIASLGFVESAFTVYGGVDYEVTETISTYAELGYTDIEDDEDYVYGAAGVTYAPGGDFETSLEGGIATNDNYQVVFSMEKTF